MMNKMKLLKGIDFNYSGGWCNNAILIDKYAITAVDGYIFVYNIQNDTQEQYSIVDDNEIDMLKKKYPFIHGVEIFRMSRSRKSGNIKLLIDYNCKIERAYFDRIDYSSCFDRIIQKNTKTLLLVDREYKIFCWLDNIIKADCIAEGHIIYYIPKEHKVVAVKCKVYNIPPTIRVVEDNAIEEGIARAIEIKPKLWINKYGGYFYGSIEEAVDYIKETIIEESKEGG